MYFFVFSLMAILNKCMALLLLCSFLLFSSFRVDGVEEDISLTKEEELEINNQFKLLNKPAVRTIKTTYGDLYDCVDFYKQLAFDYPSLKNHTYHPQMRPSGHLSVSKRIKGNKRSKDEQIRFLRVDCPFGTVPVRRVTKEELVRTKLHEKRYALTHGVLSYQEPGVHYATVGTIFDPENMKYRGGSAYMSVYNVTVNDPRQYSLVRMRIQSGTDSIEVGTMTNPGIYNTLDTHIFIRTKTSALDCFNLRCPGFVQVTKDYVIDPRVVPVSQYGRDPITVKFSIVKDKDTGYWWFYLGESNIIMGFWSTAYFTGGMQGVAYGLDWGGEVSGPLGIPSVPMGTGGECPVRDRRKEGHCKLMKVLNHVQREGDVLNTQTTCDSAFYKALDEGIVNSHFGHMMYFGGPGDGGTQCPYD